MKIKRILQQIFSVTNSEDKRHKIVTILGLKLKIRIKKYIEIKINNTEAKTNNIEAKTNNIETKINNIEAKTNNIETKINNIEAKINNIKTKVNSTEAMINNLQNLFIWSSDAEKIPLTRGPLRIYQDAYAKFLRYCADIFDKHNLKYWLHAGTLLGCVRYQDFIPWDDDIDTAMMREDYDKLADILTTEFKDDPNLYFTKGDIIKILYRGIPMQVDVFAFDIYPRYLCDNTSIHQLKEKMQECRNEIIYDYTKIYTGNCIVNKTDEELAEMRNRIYNAPQTEKKMIVQGFEHSPGYNGYMVLDYDWVFPLKEAKFAGYTFTIPNRSDMFLYEKFGDYTHFSKRINSHFRPTSMDMIRICEFSQEFNKETP